MTGKPHDALSFKKWATQFIGLAVRARRVAIGSDAAMTSVQKKQASVVLLASDAGPNVVKKFRDKCAFYNIQLLEVFTRSELGQACGRESLVVIAVTDPGFATKLRQFAGEFLGGEAFDETSGI